MKRMRLGAHAWQLTGMLGALGLAACVNLSPFACTDDLQCDSATGGRCMGPGFCAFPDDECESGYRYHASATGNLSATCVEPTLADTGTSSVTTSAPTTMSATDGSTSGLTATDGSGTSGTVTADGTSESSDDGNTSTTGGPCGDMPCPCTTAIAAGANHNCALRTDDVIVCWGRADWGHLGSGMTMPVFEDDPQPIVAPGAKFAAMALNFDHGCAITDTGETWCWGRNNTNQSAPMSGGNPVVPTNDGNTTDAQIVEAGLQHSCTVNAEGMMTCWGSNTYGQLGTPMSGPGPRTTGPYGDGTVLGMAAGSHHACMHTGDAVLCWGRHNFGQNGSGMMGDDLDTPTEVMLPVGDGTVAVAAGRHHSCAAVAGGTEIYCWGRNHCGQVDDTSLNCSGQAIAWEPTLVPLQGTVTQMVGRNDNTCALMDDGTAYCWGARQGYWIGTGVDNGTTVYPPEPIVVFDEIEEPVVQLALGNQHACGLVASGRLWCWGSDQYEQLGFNDPDRGMRTVEMDLLCP